MQPYYVFPPAPAEPAYLEFRVGDDEDELGIIDRAYAPGATGEAGGAVMFRHVDDLKGTLDNPKMGIKEGWRAHVVAARRES